MEPSDAARDPDVSTAKPIEVTLPSTSGLKTPVSKAPMNSTSFPNSPSIYSELSELSDISYSIDFSPIINDSELKATASILTKVSDTANDAEDLSVVNTTNAILPTDSSSPTLNSSNRSLIELSRPNISVAETPGPISRKSKLRISTLAENFEEVETNNKRQSNSLHLLKKPKASRWYCF